MAPLGLLDSELFSMKLEKPEPYQHPHQMPNMRPYYPEDRNPGRSIASYLDQAFHPNLYTPNPSPIRRPDPPATIEKNKFSPETMQMSNTSEYYAKHDEVIVRFMDAYYRIWRASKHRHLKFDTDDEIDMNKINARAISVCTTVSSKIKNGAQRLPRKNNLKRGLNSQAKLALTTQRLSASAPSSTSSSTIKFQHKVEDLRYPPHSITIGNIKPTKEELMARFGKLHGNQETESKNQLWRAPRSVTPTPPENTNGKMHTNSIFSDLVSAMGSTKYARTVRVGSVAETWQEANSASFTATRDGNAIATAATATTTNALGRNSGLWIVSEEEAYHGRIVVLAFFMSALLLWTLLRVTGYGPAVRLCWDEAKVKMHRMGWSCFLSRRGRRVWMGNRINAASAAIRGDEMETGVHWVDQKVYGV